MTSIATRTMPSLVVAPQPRNAEMAAFHEAGERWPTFDRCHKCGARLYLTFPEESYVGGRGTVRRCRCYVDGCEYSHEADRQQVMGLIGLRAEFDGRRGMLDAIRDMESGVSYTFAVMAAQEAELSRDEADTVRAVMADMH